MKQIITYMLNKDDQKAITTAKNAQTAINYVRTLADNICRDFGSKPCEECPLIDICEQGSECIPLDKLIDFLDSLPKEK